MEEFHNIRKYCCVSNISVLLTHTVLIFCVDHRVGSNAPMDDQECSHISHLRSQAFSLNDPLSDADRELISETIMETESHVKYLNDDIAQLNAAIAHIEGHCTKIISYISRLRLGITPHRDIPPEILANIFVKCTITYGPLHGMVVYPCHIGHRLLYSSKCSLVVSNWSLSKLVHRTSIMMNPISTLFAWRTSIPSFLPVIVIIPLSLLFQHYRLRRSH